MQRPRTLVPRAGETDAQDVVEAKALLSEELNRDGPPSIPSWALRSSSPHGVVIPDRRPSPSSSAPGLTEVEVHGTDLGLNFDDWSDIFEAPASRRAFDRLNIRRADLPFDRELEGSWLLVATDGPAYKVTVIGPKVESGPASPDTQARAVLEATSRDRLALLLVSDPPRSTGHHR